MRIDKLYEKLAVKFGEEEAKHDGKASNFIVRPKRGYAKVRVGDYGSGADSRFGLTRSDTFSSIVAISKHFVTKPLYRITAHSASDSGRFSVTTTADHTCAVYSEMWHELDSEVKARNAIDLSKYPDEKMVSFKSACELREGDAIPIARPPAAEMAGECFDFGYYYSCDGVGYVDGVEEIDNSDGQFVYDIEVESGRHVYYANGILVHNSQFVNIAPITKKFCREAGISEDTTFAELPDGVRDSIVKKAYELHEMINENVARLVDAECHTTHGCDIHYALEYVAAEGFYFAKKCYIVRKILSDGLPCNKFKYSGISVKKAEIPASMKNFLKDIYESTMTRDGWSESDYRHVVEDAYSKFVKMDWNDVAYYKKMRTAKAALNELGTESEKGAGAHARACNFYNGLIKELGVAGKYPNISLGDEMRYSYVLPNNEYGQDVIAFKGEFPEEFRKIFKIDYVKMFDKIFTSSLKRYVEIMGYSTVDPTKQVEDPDFDIF